MAHPENLDPPEDAVLGRGAYGTVYRANRPALRAIKIIPYKQTIPADVVREIAMLKMLQKDGSNDGCVKLLGFRILETCVELEFEYGTGGTLQKMLRDHPPPALSTRLLWAGQLLAILAALHEKNMAHRDVKPQNIVLTAAGDVKLIDFGLSRPFAAGTPLTPLVCTLYYRPPELLAHYVSHGGDDRAGLVYGAEADCWSAGCVLRELLTDQGPEFRPNDAAADHLVSSAQQLEAIIMRFGFQFSVFDTDEVAAFCASDAVLPDVSTPSTLENAAREISRGLLIPSPSSRATCREARQELFQVEILERLERCWLQASSFDLGVSMPAPGFCVTSIGPPAASRAEKTEMRRLLKRITPDMARLLDNLVAQEPSAASSPLSGTHAAWGVYMARARRRMAELWPRLRDMHVEAAGAEEARVHVEADVKEPHVHWQAPDVGEPRVHVDIEATSDEEGDLQEHVARAA